MKTFLLMIWGISSASLIAAEEVPLASSDKAISNQARAIYLEKGQDSLPELRQHSKSDDPRLRARANEVLGTITGQYGSVVDLVWNRSLAEAMEAAEGEKPILFLHLFGKFDEEFC